jgi:two-component system, OmpR family, phosphate regulon response regulator OmpR
MSVAYQPRIGVNPASIRSRTALPARVLIMSADTLRLRHWRAMLVSKKFSVAAARPDEAVGSVLTDESFDVILLDSASSHATGLSLCRRLRAAGVTLPILILDPYGEVEDLLDAFEAGTDAYVCDHAGDAELLRWIGALCCRRGVAARGDACSLVAAMPRA